VGEKKRCGQKGIGAKRGIAKISHKGTAYHFWMGRYISAEGGGGKDGKNRHTACEYGTKNASVWLDVRSQQERAERDDLEFRGRGRCWGGGGEKPKRDYLGTERSEVAKKLVWSG